MLLLCANSDSISSAERQEKLYTPILSILVELNSKEEVDMPEKSSNEPPGTEAERPKIYVTPRGARYVKADELLRSKRGRAVVNAMAKLDFKQTSSDTSSEDSP